MVFSSSLYFPHLWVFPPRSSSLALLASGRLKMSNSPSAFAYIYFYNSPFPPDTKVYAALGNHDFHPKNQFPAGSNNIYNQVAELWRPWLNNESIAPFKEGINTICYYKHSLCVKVWSNTSSHEHPHEIGTNFIQIRRLRLKDTKSLGQGHPA